MRTKLFNIVTLALLSITVSTATAAPKQEPKKQTTSKKQTTVKKGITVQPSKVVYKKPTPTVKATFSLPSTSITISNKGVNLHLSNGRYYRQDAGRYIAVAPPRGMKIRALPAGYVALSMMGMAYYYYEGIYYQQSGKEYVVVNAPEDIVVSSLPEETEQVTYEGKDYYIYNNDIYSVVITPDGKAFKKVGELDIS